MTTRCALSLLLTVGGCCRTINGIDIAGRSTGTGTVATSGTTSGATSGATTGTSTGTTGGSGCPPTTYTVTPGPLTPRNSLAAAFGSDGLAYIAGGTMFDGGPMALVEVLDPQTGIVTTGPSMLAARSGFSLVASPDGRTLYAIGGFDADGGAIAPESFEVATQAWSPLPTLPQSTGPILATVLNDGRVLAIVAESTGFDGGLNAWVLTSGTWQAGPEIGSPTPFFVPAAASPGPGSVVYFVDKQLQLIAWDAAADGGGSTVVAVRNWPSQPSIAGTLTDFSFVQAGHFLFVTGGLVFAFDCPYQIGNVALDLDDLDAGWNPINGLLPVRDKATTAVSADQQLYLFGGETSSWCCPAPIDEISRDMLGSFEVSALDGGP